MKNHKMMWRALALGVGLFGPIAFGSAPVFASHPNEPGGAGCNAVHAAIPAMITLGTTLHADLVAALNAALPPAVGLNNDMWGTIVDRNGIVCAVAHTGAAVGDQWPASRAISAQKANTANSLSRPAGVRGFAGALSTANLWAGNQPGRQFFGLQFSNPVDPAVAYGANDDPDISQGADKNVPTVPPGYGTVNDPLVGKFIGGVNVFGGGLALYVPGGVLLGGIGLSGDTACADHVKAWRARDALDLDSVPAGVSPTGDDNMIQDIVGGTRGIGNSPSGFGHPSCGFGEEPFVTNLPTTNPID